MSQNNHVKNRSSNSGWRTIAICMLVILVPWALYVNIHPSNKNEKFSLGSDFSLTGVQSAQLLGQIAGKYFERAST